MSIVTSMTTGVSEREANDALNAYVCKGPPQHEEVCLGLFTLVLTEPAQAQKVRCAAGGPRPYQYELGLRGASYLAL